MEREWRDATGAVARLRRHGRLLGAGARILGHRLRHGDLASPAAAAAVRAALGGLRGPAMKTAQILASLPDVLPPALARELATLQTQAPPMGPAFIRRRMRAELGADWADRFARFEMRPRFAASFGQVHRAVLPDGRAVALKLQYPAMEEAVAADLAELRMVLGLLSGGRGVLDPQSVLAELRLRLAEELDYVREAANMRRFARAFARLGMNAGVRVPAVVEELTTRRLLAMEWVEGVPLLEAAANASQALRDRMGERLFVAWYRPFFAFGLLHGDPHPGNYRWEVMDGDAQDDAAGRLLLLDFGCVRVFSGDFVAAVGDLWRALRAGADDAARAAVLERWGFGPLDARQAAALGPWLDLLFEPLLDDRVRPMAVDEAIAVRGLQALDRVRAGLREAGRIRPPAEFVLLHRSAVLLGAVLQRIGARANWCRLFGDMIADADRCVRAAAAGRSGAARDGERPARGTT